ncbi:MAG: DNA repair protein RecN [Lachnospiraceae bacterium]|nr:DNA repair protein RecN [Lachnospiraceae bacterium]
MLTNIHVKNFAIIDEADIDLADNLNIFTGETGAGKSLLLGALNMALGARTLKDIVRADADFALSEVTFTGLPEKAKELLDKEGFTDADEVVISKKLLNNGRSVLRINGETASTGLVKELAGCLIDIYGQNEHQSLLKKEHQLFLVDEYAGDELTALKEKVKEQYKKYSELKKESEGLNDDEQARKRRADLLEYEINEIKNAQIKDGEEEELKDRHRLLANARLISEGLAEAHNALDGDGRASDCLTEAIRALSRISEYDDRLAEMTDALSDIDGVLSDAVRDINDYMDTLPDDSRELDEVEERLDLIMKLKSKYGATVKQINDYYDNAVEELDRLSDYEGYSKKLKADCEEAEKALLKSCKELTKLREASAKKLGSMIKDALGELNFNQTEFKIEISQKENYSANGMDECVFMMSMNPGESVRPLQDVASGGELSRIMLGIKSVMAGKEGVGTLIFDEIDAGISGRTAQKVSEKLSKIAAGHQVICITHLAQIASMADSHYEIIKQVEDGRTRTGIRRLGDKEITNELARLIGGAELTDKVYESAAEMKKLADERKQSIRSNR